MVGAWLLLIASGASTTGLLRAPVGMPGLGPAMLTSHIVAGAALGLTIVVRALRSRRPARLWSVAAIVSTVALGWFATRSFAPLTVAGHAAIAAYVIAVLVDSASVVSSGMGNSQPPRTWKSAAARLGFVLLLLQIALGALLRHHLVSVLWHLLTGGLAAVAILVPAVAVTQEPSATDDQRRAARWAIASVLVQVSLGLGALFMILLGTSNVVIWLGTTMLHVVGGSVTLLAATGLTRALRTRRSAHGLPVRATP
jgi:hypothetical protein